MHKNSVALWSLAIFLPLVGCVSTQTRPVEWPQDRVLSEPKEIVGSYRIEGVLGGKLSSKPWPTIEKAADCTISVMSGSTGQIILQEGAVTVDTWPFTFDIHEGWLRARPIAGTWVAPENGIVAKKNFVLLIRPDSSGGLIVRYMESNVGVMVIIPLVVKDELWFRLSSARAAK